MVKCRRQENVNAFVALKLELLDTMSPSIYPPLIHTFANVSYAVTFAIEVESACDTSFI